MGMLMYDSTNPFDIPENAPMVAGYVTGKYAWPVAGWLRFNTPRKVRIVVSASSDAGDVLDVEKGDATPDQAPAWIKMRQASGLWKPTIYCEVSAVGAVRDFCKGLQYDLWIAHYTGHQHSEAGAVATQFADPATSGGHYDLSWVDDSDWPHRVAPVHQLGEDDNMPTLVNWNGADYIVGYDAEKNEYWRRTLPNLSREAQLVGGGAVRTNNGGSFPVTNDQFLTVYQDRGQA